MVMSPKGHVPLLRSGRRPRGREAFGRERYGIPRRSSHGQPLLVPVPLRLVVSRHTTPGGVDKLLHPLLVAWRVVVPMPSTWRLTASRVGRSLGARRGFGDRWNTWLEARQLNCLAGRVSAGRVRRFRRGGPGVTTYTSAARVQHTSRDGRGCRHTFVRLTR